MPGVGGAGGEDIVGEVVELADRRPHLNLECRAGHVHVLPISYLLKVAEGDEAMEPLPECVRRRVLVEWLACVWAGSVERSVSQLELWT